MAREYGFDYEFVQYKWPGWLHHQTEKQRIIWGYLLLGFCSPTDDVNYNIINAYTSMFSLCKI